MTPCWRARSRSRCSIAPSQAIPRSSTGSGARRAPRPASRIPNIVAVYDWGAVDGVYYMVMEYVRGPSVRHLLNEQGRMEPAQAAEILRQTLLALGHAHHEGFVHRDMKPENLLVTQDGIVKVADFGLARAYADGRVTQAGAVTGTVQYLAPEQIRGEPADPRSDLYSLGIVAYELLDRAAPVHGRDGDGDRVQAPVGSRARPLLAPSGPPRTSSTASSRPRRTATASFGRSPPT